jgi:TrpR-related protein YerC/YecD
MNDLFDAILALETKEECESFFEDLCTVKEILDMAQRLAVARMLYEGKSYTEITRRSGMSAATISRVNRCLKYGAGGYQTVLERLDSEKNRKGSSQENGK